MLNGVKSVEADADVGFINLQDVEIKSCTGCETCMKKHIAGEEDFSGYRIGLPEIKK